MKTLTSLINGQRDLAVDVADRGLNYGDGLFETIQIRDRVPLLWDRHILRMRLGAGRLKIPFDDALEAAYLADFTQLIAASKPANAVLKLLLTRGITQRGYKIEHTLPVTRISRLSSAPDMTRLQREGIAVVLCATQLARQPLLAGIKHLNRLEQVLARSEWDQPDITEGIVCDTAGHVIEGCMSNLFWIKDKVLYTPLLSMSGVEGVVRNLLLALCKCDGLLEIREGFYVKQALLNGDEIFLSNSIFDILPVISIQADYSEESANFTPVDFTLGPYTKALQQLLQQHYLKEASV